MNTEEIVREQVYRVRRMYPKWFMDPDFYPAKHYLRKRLRSVIGKNFVVMLQDSAIRVCYGDKMVVV